MVAPTVPGGNGGRQHNEEREKHIHHPRPHCPGVGKSQGLTSISRTVVQNKHQDVHIGAGGDGLQDQVLEEGLGLQGGTGAERQAPLLIRDTFPQRKLSGLDLVLWSEHFTSSLEVGSFFSWLLQDPGIWVWGLGGGGRGRRLGLGVFGNWDRAIGDSKNENAF